jgi:hypothetical protein
MKPGQIPGWWWCLKYKPDPTVLFDADWPDEIDPYPHLRNQELIHGRYRNRSWYPAFRRGISWYQLCRERESMQGRNVSFRQACVNQKRYPCATQ